MVADALDPEQVADAVAEAKPEVIIHELTAIAALDLRHFDRDFALTNRLRTEGTDHLLSAGRAVGVKRFIAQSYASWPYARTGGAGQDRGGPARPGARHARCASRCDAIRHLEAAVVGADWTEGIVLRYGALLRSRNTSLSPGGEQFEMVRKRKFPVIGNGGGVWSFVHVADAADATVAAVERGERGIYNVVDDEPAPVAEWLPALAAVDRRAEAVAGAACSSAGCWRGEAGDRDDDRDPRRIEREGQARAGLAAPAPELATGVRGMSAGERAARRAATGVVRDRLPDARQRRRGRGRRPGGAAAGPPRARGAASGSSRRARSWRR